MSPDFFTRSDVLQIARDLLGKYLLSAAEGELTGGIIVETEAYSHCNDQAMNAHIARRKHRSQQLYAMGGFTYIYPSYGHCMLNIVTNIKGKSDAVLVRAIKPVTGINVMRRRRRLQNADERLCAGPGMLTQALAVTQEASGRPVSPEGLLWVEDKNETISQSDILASPRVGIAYAGKDADLPWRFRLANCRFTSRSK